MSIEVTDADVEAVEAIVAKSDSDRASNSWECVDPKEIIAAAWQVMEKKQREVEIEVQATKIVGSIINAISTGRQINFVLTHAGDCKIAVVKNGDLHTQTIPVSNVRSEFDKLAGETIEALSEKVRQ